MDLSERRRSERAKRRSMLALWIITVSQVFLFIVLWLSAAIALSAAAKLTWRAMQYGWSLW